TAFFSSRGYAVDNNNFYMTADNSTEKDFMSRVAELPAGTWHSRVLSDGKEVLTYVVKLPYYSINEPARGYLFIDVERNYVYNAVARIMNASGRLYILDHNGMPVFNNGGSTEDELVMVRMAMQAGTPVNEFSSGDDRYVLAQFKSPENDWTYVMVRPLNAFALSTKAFQTQLFACGLAVLVFGFIISYFMSRQLYTPLKGLIQYIRGAYQHSGQGSQTWVNEYAYIGNALKNMDEKIGLLEAKTKRSELRNLVLGAPMGLEQMDMLPPGYGYSTGYIRILEGSPELLGEYYDQMEHPVPGIFIALNQAEAAIIYYARENNGADHASAIIRELEQLQEGLGQDMRFGGATGSWVESVENIPISYQAAKMAYRYCFFAGTEAIIHYGSVRAFSPVPLAFSFEQYQHLLKAGDINGTNRFIGSFAEALRENMQLEAVELALLQISSSIYQVVLELELQLLLPPSNLFDELKKDTLEATLDNIRSLSVQIATHVKESGNQAHAEVVQKLKAYIDEHLEDNLSLNILSEVASLAPAYVSTLFGEVMKESFTDYVTRVRLDKAAAMLRTNTDLSVTEIAGQVGYKNVQYFHNKFKQKYGVTPVQYRHAMKS
ncbi:MAG: hypothetical protein K0Q90_4431, partial [Paenibacillaceae bacterium]|nr:hypothetical protein [Paenibacillaceae bacterium]